jgi:hypothetical protein
MTLEEEPVASPKHQGARVALAAPEDAREEQVPAVAVLGTDVRGQGTTQEAVALRSEKRGARQVRFLDGAATIEGEVPDRCVLVEVEVAVA